jgi:DNA-binding transcriptional regulator GbsR (MarR family)
MTELTDKKSLPEAARKFILYWGDMGDRWGLNRSVSQIHALLYVSERPLTADEIADTLDMARSNVSNSLKELQNWDLVRRVPVMGDRRDHFEADADIWSIAAKIADGRKQRELDPAMTALTECVAAAKDDPQLHPVAAERLRAMLDFTRTMTNWYEQMAAIPKPALMMVIKMGAKIVGVLPMKKAK